MIDKLSKKEFFFIGIFVGLIFGFIFLFSIPFEKSFCINPVPHQVTYKLVQEFHKLYYFAQYEDGIFVNYVTKTTKQINPHVYYTCTNTCKKSPFSIMLCE